MSTSRSDHHDDDNDERNAAHNDGPVTHANGAIDLIADTGQLKTVSVRMAPESMPPKSTPI